MDHAGIEPGTCARRMRYSLLVVRASGIGRRCTPLAVFALAVGSGCSPDGGKPSAPSSLDGTASFCGDGRVDPGEQCDDGNQDDADECLRTCFRPARWVPSDPHIHGRGCGVRLGPDELLRESSERGIEVTAALIWGSGFAAERRYFTGNDDPASGPGRLLHYDLEVSHFAADRTGHLVLLGLYSIDFSADPYVRPQSLIPVLSWALGQGPRVVAGMAHGQFWPSDGGFPPPGRSCCVPWDFPPEAIRGRLTFLESERLSPGPPLDPGTELLWRSVLNAGARVALAGASDYPCIHDTLTDQTPRTDVLLDGEVSYNAWLDALRAGRTVLVRGRDHHLNLRVAGQPLGSEVSVGAGETLRLSVETVASDPVTVTILVNGAPKLSVPMEAGTRAAAATLSLTESAWIAATSAWATTSPIYVVVGGQPIRGPAEDICYLRLYMDYLSGLVRRGRLDLGSERRLALDTYAAVARELDVRFAEAGGTTCP